MNLATLTLQFSVHARTRMRQRAIGEGEIAIALVVGRLSRSGGDQIYTITDRSLRGSEWAHLADRLRGLSVVVTDNDTVRTVMWNYRTRRRGCLQRRLREAA